MQYRQYLMAKPSRFIQTAGAGLSAVLMTMRYFSVLVEICKRRRWGAWSLVSLYISIASGIVVGLQYDLTTPFYSVTALDLLVPYGEFFRSAHFYSSQLFFLFGCAHLLAVFDRTENYSAREWLLLIFSLAAALFLLFTGYVLRADSTGFSAGVIAEAILKTIPIVGNMLDTLLFSVSEKGMHRVYLHHVITLDVLWLLLAWDHLRRYRVKITDHIPLICLTLGFCLVVAAPLEPERLGVSYISGPWFFLGLQELLRYAHPLFAGVLFPATFLVALLYARKQNSFFLYLLRFLYGWLIVYAVLTAVAWLR